MLIDEKKLTLSYSAAILAYNHDHKNREKNLFLVLKRQLVLLTNNIDEILLLLFLLREMMPCCQKTGFQFSKKIIQQTMISQYALLFKGNLVITPYHLLISLTMAFVLSQIFRKWDW